MAQQAREEAGATQAALQTKFSHRPGQRPGFRKLVSGSTRESMRREDETLGSVLAAARARAALGSGSTPPEDRATLVQPPPAQPPPAQAPSSRHAVRREAMPKGRRSTQGKTLQIAEQASTREHRGALGVETQKVALGLQGSKKRSVKPKQRPGQGKDQHMRRAAGRMAPPGLIVTGLHTGTPDW